MSHSRLYHHFDLLATDRPCKSRVFVRIAGPAPHLLSTRRRAQPFLPSQPSSIQPLSTAARLILPSAASTTTPCMISKSDGSGQNRNRPAGPSPNKCKGLRLNSRANGRQGHLLCIVPRSFARRRPLLRSLPPPNGRSACQCALPGLPMLYGTGPQLRRVWLRSSSLLWNHPHVHHSKFVGPSNPREERARSPFQPQLRAFVAPRSRVLASSGRLRQVPSVHSLLVDAPKHATS